MNYILERENGENIFSYIHAETARQRELQAVTLESKISAKIRKSYATHGKYPTLIYLGQEEIVAYPKFFVYTEPAGATFTFNTKEHKDSSRISFHDDHAREA